MLRDAGIAVEVLELDSAKQCIQGFAKRITQQRPWVRIKTATSLDGSVALANGASHWITGAAARADVQYWRARSDAIVTGVGTVIADDPKLTVRDPSYVHATPPLRVVLDSHGRIPSDAQILQGPVATLLVHQRDSAGSELAAADHIQQLHLADGPEDLDGLLVELSQRGCNEVLIEAGPAVVGSFLKAGLWDEWIAYVAPKLLGADSQSVTNLLVTHIPDAQQARLVQTVEIGDDLRLTLRP
jgi:diaminohydroxyphosphoribosylaminopyrimidine deaminase/5-amino-6-(5-phosphoribosylamino)uracil reductase